jgi:glycine dehydrogenase subunit 2
VRCLFGPTHRGNHASGTARTLLIHLPVPVNEAVARVEGIANGHPYQPEKISQRALQIIKTLSEQRIEITGMDAITLQPAAGAHGEMTGLLMVRAYHQSKGNAPRRS